VTSFVAQVVADILSLGSLYALTALGIGLVFGVMRLVNFAHGDLITMAGYAILALAAYSVAGSIALALVAGIVLPLATERVALRPVRNAEPTTLLVSSFSVYRKLLVDKDVEN
jgi:branched-chain amino acid transport system permease protein